MKNLIAFAAIVVLGAGCATTSAARGDASEDSLEVAALKARLEELEKQNGELKKGTDSREAAVAPRPVRPVVVPMAPAVGQTMVPPPPKPLPPGPPQNWAWLHSPPYGCNGPFLLTVKNWESDMFIRLLVDGEEIVVRGANGPLAITAPDGSMMTPLPPRETVYMCLKSLGSHTVSGIIYLDRMGVLAEVKRFSRSVNFTLNSGQNGGQRIGIDDMFIAGF